MKIMISIAEWRTTRYEEGQPVQQGEEDNTVTVTLPNGQQTTLTTEEGQRFVGIEIADGESVTISAG